MSSTPQILYFDIRGRAEPIRLLLEDTGVQYSEKRISLEDWKSKRPATPFQRMPVYSEGDRQIPESFAIMNYLGRKYGLLGDDEIARIRCDVAIEAWRDYGNRVANIFGAQSISEFARKEFIKLEQPALLKNLETFYVDRAVNSHYWAGKAPTVADYIAFHLIDGIVDQFPKLLSQASVLKEFHKKFSERPNIRKYLDSSRRPAALFYGPEGKIYPRKN